MLDGRVAVVTGSSRGIGKATALALAEQGAMVTINYLTHEMEANSVAAEIQARGGSAIVIRADVADAEQVTRMIDKVIEHYGRLDILINNAGAIVRPAGWQEITEDIWNRTLEINLRGTFYCIRASARYLLDSDSASIVNIASTFGAVIGAPGVIAYAAAKSGVFSITRSFAKALAPSVRVNCIAPGIIDTDMTSGSPPSFVQQEIENTPLRRIGTPEDVADTVLYLVSPWSRFVTGQMIVVDGGHSLR